ncbi:MAG: glycosyltransferase [Anaerolineae bacterium]|nr:glycosyltransferase [Anaerolineae bacterium]
MLEGQDIVCIAPESWDGLWRNRHQIMLRLSARNRVLFVSGPEPIKHCFQNLRRACLGKLEKVRDNLYAYCFPDLLLESRFPIIDAFTFEARLLLLKNVMRKLAFSNPILWLYHPTMGRLVGRLNERLVCYHIVDEYIAYPVPWPMGNEAFIRMEQQLIAAADVVLVSSEELLRSKGRMESNIHWVPNAVDFQGFAQSLRGPQRVPSDLTTLPRPIIGYVGAIKEKLDFDLLALVARTHPEWSLVMIGPVQLHGTNLAFENLRRLDNVFLLGCKPVESLPLYIKACSVCLLPYVINDWTRHIDPLKLYEYLAVGNPVVSVDIPAVRRFSEVLSIAADKEDFVYQIECALQEHDSDMRRVRQAIAAENSWDHRVATISDIIRTSLHASGSR